MTQPPLQHQPVDADLPDELLVDPAITRRPSRFAWIWLVPLVAALAGATLLARDWMNRGPEIVITFKTAEGLQAGQTQVRYKDVTVGTVTRIELSDDWSEVEVTAAISKHAEELASAGSRFWVVRPRLGLSGISGLGTLLSGAYIEVDVPEAVADGERDSQTRFTGLEVPPEITTDRAGSRYVVEAATLGSLDVGSPVYFRQIRVGQVTGYQLDTDGSDVDIHIFIDAPYDRFVTLDTRFWDASGIDLTLSPEGLTLRTQSLLTIALGGIAFEPMSLGNDAPAASGHMFPLYRGEAQARAVPDSVVLPVQMRFDQSIRGLAVGAEVDFKGIKLGEVTSIGLNFDEDTRTFYAVVDANLYPRRLGPVYDTVETFARDQLHARNLFEPLIANGLRAQLRTKSLLTGQLYVVIDTFENASPVTLGTEEPFRIPTIPGELAQIQQRVTQILSRIEQFPVEALGKQLQGLLSDTSRMIRRLDNQVTPEAQALLKQATTALQEISGLLATDAPLVQNSELALQEMTRAARSLRNLADFLQANPDSLIRGR